MEDLSIRWSCEDEDDRPSSPGRSFDSRFKRKSPKHRPVRVSPARGY